MGSTIRDPIMIDETFPCVGIASDTVLSFSDVGNLVTAKLRPGVSEFRDMEGFLGCSFN